MNSISILDVRIDRVEMNQALEIVEDWLKEKGKHVIVTPNVEFVLQAQTDPKFKQILNEADLAIPDSARFGWAEKVLSSKYLVLRLLYLPFVLAPRLISDFPVTTGTDLMFKLCETAAEKGYAIALLGGGEKIAAKTAECLKQSYPSLNITFSEAGGRVDQEGNSEFRVQSSKFKTDILFVAFGQVKQEKWISQNLDKLDIKLAVGVGGAFDYISGQVPRAPSWLRNLGFEWLFRLIIQPWRLKRQLRLIEFIGKLLNNN